MLETLTNETYTAPQERLNNAAKPRKVLHMIENERMGGKIPVWRTPETPQEQIEHNLATAHDAGTLSFENTLAYTGTHIHEPTLHEQEFGFGDLVDMVNPLHHIPLVGHVYREVTGDEIKPISNIIGGAVFGGPAGAASGIVNAIVEEETGKDIAENAVALALNGQTPTLKNSNAKPQERLNDALSAREDLPGNLLSFTDLSAGHEKGFKTERTSTIGEYALPPREPITQVRLSGLYALAE